MKLKVKQSLECSPFGHQCWFSNFPTTLSNESFLEPAWPPFWLQRVRQIVLSSHPLIIVSNLLPTRRRSVQQLIARYIGGIRKVGEFFVYHYRDNAECCGTGLASVKVDTTRPPGTFLT